MTENSTKFTCDCCNRFIFVKYSDIKQTNYMPNGWTKWSAEDEDFDLCDKCTVVVRRAVNQCIADVARLESERHECEVRGLRPREQG